MKRDVFLGVMKRGERLEKGRLRNELCNFIYKVVTLSPYIQDIYIYIKVKDVSVVD